MPVLKYLADTNALSDYFKPGNPVKAWFLKHRGQIGISTLSLAEMRRGIELKSDTKAGRHWRQIYDFILEDYREAIFVFDELAAAEWGRLMAAHRDQLPPYEDSLIGAIALSYGLTVATRNAKDFPANQTVNPWTD